MISEGRAWRADGRAPEDVVGAEPGGGMQAAAAHTQHKPAHVSLQTREAERRASLAREAALRQARVRAADLTPANHTLERLRMHDRRRVALQLAAKAHATAATRSANASVRMATTSHRRRLAMEPALPGRLRSQVQAEELPGVVRSSDYDAGGNIVDKAGSKRSRHVDSNTSSGRGGAGAGFKAHRRTESPTDHNGTATQPPTTSAAGHSTSGDGHPGAAPSAAPPTAFNRSVRLQPPPGLGPAIVHRLHELVSLSSSRGNPRLSEHLWEAVGYSPPSGIAIGVVKHQAQASRKSPHAQLPSLALNESWRPRPAEVSDLLWSVANLSSRAGVRAVDESIFAFPGTVLNAQAE